MQSLESIILLFSPLHSRLKIDPSNNGAISLTLTEFYLLTIYSGGALILVMGMEWNVFSLLVIILYQQQK